APTTATSMPRSTPYGPELPSSGRLGAWVAPATDQRRTTEQDEWPRAQPGAIRVGASCGPSRDREASAAERLQRAGERAAVDQDVRPGEEARLRRAQERAGGAEAFDIAEPLRRDAFDPLGARLLVADAFALGDAAEHGLEPVGLERAGQQVVDRHVARRD